jgi:hypothetical protein
MRHVILRNLALLVGLGVSALAAEVDTAWRVDFDDTASIGGVRYVRRGQTQDGKGLIATVAGGALTFGAAVDTSGAPWDRAVLAWGRCMPYGFWRWPETAFAPLDMQRYPILEVRARRAPGMEPVVCLTPTFDTPSGISFTQMGLVLTDEWQTFSFRFSPLSNVPGPRTPTRVLGMVFLVQPGGRASGLEIDWVRVRSFTPEEKAEDDVIVAHLSTYKPPPWKQPFFVYGPYGPSLYSTAWQGGLEGAYGGMVEAHMNYLMCPHDLSYYRYQGRAGKTQEENAADFIAVNRQAADTAARVGLTMSLDIRGFHTDLKARGLDYIVPPIKQVTDAFRSHPAVLGYTAGDEPQTNTLWEVVGVKEVFEKNDPAKLVAFPLADALWAPDFEPYSTIHVGDRYPIVASNRSCADVANQMDQYNGATDKPVWMITQAIGDKEWWTPAPAYQTPTDAEFLRMAFMAISRGAKGLLLFDWYHTPWVSLTDRCGQPGSLLPVASRLGERLAALGPILLRCSVQKDLPGSPAQDSFEVRALRLTQPQGTLYIVGNTDLTNPRDLEVSAGPAADGRVVLDLESLQVGADARLKAAAVAPGDARFFALIAPEEVAALEGEIRASRRQEAARAAQPGRMIAARWAGEDQELGLLDATLDTCAAGLMSLERRLLIGDGKARPGKEDAYRRFMELGGRYDTLRSRWIAADGKGLAADIDRLKKDLEELAQTP